MKTTLMLLVLANSAFAAVPILARTTPEALAKLQQDNPMTLLQSPPKGAAKVNRPEDQSIIKQYTLLLTYQSFKARQASDIIFYP